jgi:hypothetical protein
VKEVKNDFSDLKKPVFYQILLGLFPIDFDLKPQKYLTNNPSKLKIGLSNITESEVALYIQVPQESIPINDIQLVMLKERYSEKPLTKAQIKEIELNYYSGLILSYAYYMFKFTDVENLQLRVVKNMPDPATGKNILNLVQGIKVSKFEFEKINISRVVPFEAVKNFSNLNSISSQDVIYWSRLFYNKFYTIEKDILDALISDDEIEFSEDFKGLKRIQTPMSKDLHDLKYKLSKYTNNSKDKDDFTMNHKGTSSNKEIPVIKNV